MPKGQYVRTPEMLERLRQMNLGKNNPMYGVHHSEEVKHRISKTTTGMKKSDVHRASISRGKSGEIAYNWKGDKVGYQSLHQWVRRNLPKPKVCEMCNVNEPTDCSNVSGEYKRDLSDWQYLCRPCHWVYDGIALS